MLRPGLHYKNNISKDNFCSEDYEDKAERIFFDFAFVLLLLICCACCVVLVLLSLQTHTLLSLVLACAYG